MTSFEGKMTRILVLSDTHPESASAPHPAGYIPSWVLNLAEGADRVYHAGDFNSRADYLEVKKLFGKRLFAVSGNGDRSSGNWAESEGLKELKIDTVAHQKDFHIGLIHGDQFDVNGSKVSIENARAYASENELDILIFGHIHYPLIVNGKSMLICPGSPVWPRNGANSTVAVIDIGKSSVQVEIVNRNNPNRQISAKYNI